MQLVICAIYSMSMWIFSAYAMQTHTQTRWKPEELLVYAQENDLRLPKYNYTIQQNGKNVLQARSTLNHHGACFDPEDPISKSFMADIADHRARKTSTSISTCVLEIGCGMGLLAKKVLASSAIRYDGNEPDYDNFYYVGLDLSKEHLAIATQEIAKFKKHEDFFMGVWDPYEGKFPYVSFGEETFTHIGAFHVGHFWTDEECIQSLKTFESLLMPDGKAYILMGNPHTQVYGPIPSLIYDVRKFFGTEFAGYVEDVPKIAEQLATMGLVPKEQIESPTFKEQIADHYLFVTPEDLCSLVKKHTALNIVYSGTINMHQGDKIMVHTGVIVKKESNYTVTDYLNSKK